MSRGAILFCLLIGGFDGLSAPARAADEPAAQQEPVAAADELRQKITEREDKRRPREPFSLMLGGHPLTLGGEYEIATDYLRRRILGETAPQPDRSLLEQQLELEAFYTLGLPLSAFMQVQLKRDEDLLSDSPDQVSDSYVERAEMWLYSEDIAGSGFNLDLGRLNYEDERRWWWDGQLDSVRVAYETDRFEFAVSLARELAPSRSDRDEVDAEQEQVRRLIAEASWDFMPNHVMQFFLLRQDDRSITESERQEVLTRREDESDARLTWLGARLMGAFELRSQVLLGYWLDTARVRGEERLIDFDPDVTPGQSVALSVATQDVRGWAFDSGFSTMLPLAMEPRLFAGYAYGSGDTAAGDGVERSFRQTGLKTNEAGFGGVERFENYGVALDPELSNLKILTLGGGIAALESSSFDLIYHDYRLVKPAQALRDARLDATLTGEHRALGTGFDAVLAVEEWERFEFDFIASAFRAGRAFGAEEGRWSYAGFLALRYAF